ncbi:hypothetical protein [Lentibacillus salinarum]|uniref:Transketolase C-terminal domain-containing protein n=1 Tax=Lentibacillus salinarum TaxID=446820 RepID=A0ABW3ZWM4_9BACI
MLFAEVLVENKPVPMVRVGVTDRNSESAPNEDLLKKYELTTDHVVQAVKKVLEKKS